MTTISIRLEDSMKRELESICDDMGMNLSTFFVIYAKKVLRDRKIPFEIASPEPVLEPDRLDWDKIGKLLAEAECKDGNAPGMPLDDFQREMEAFVDEAV